MKFKDKKLLIFDLDGTLINSIPDLTHSINKMLFHYGLSQLTIEQVTPFIGNGAKTLVKRALDKVSKSAVAPTLLDEALVVFKNTYQENVCNDTFLYPNVKQTLNYLRDEGYKLTICTNKPFKFVEPILEKLKIKEFFLLWVGEESLPEKKPEATPLLHLAKKMNVLPDQCVMIGDSKNDILAAKNAGIDSIGLSYGYNYNENIQDYNPELVVDNFQNLQKVL